MFVRSKIDRSFARFCRTGDPDALAVVFDRTAARLFRVALWLCRQRADAEDLLQRTFVRAIELRGQFEGGRPVLPWLMGLMANQAHKLRREQARREDAVPRVDHIVDAEVEVVAHELQDAVRAVRAKLGEPYRDVLELHLEQGLDAGEIAVRLGRPAGTVRTQLVRALEMLRKRLPSGFVAGFAPLSVGGGGGLGTVRGAVIEAARHCVPAATAATGAVVTTGIGGVVVGKKLFIVVPVVAVLLGVAVLRPWSQDPSASPPSVASPAVADLDAGKAPDGVGARAPEPLPERELLAAAAAKPETTALPLDIEVFDSSEQPVEGAFVLLGKDGVERLTENSPTASAVGITDAQGKLHVADAPQALRFVGAVQPGRGVATWKWRKWSDAVKLRLFVIGTTLHGRVVRHDGSGVGRAKVILHQFLVLAPPSAGVNLGGAAAERTVSADAEGCFAIPVSAGWGTCSLSARTGSNYSKWVRVHTDDPDELRDVRIVMPGRVELRGMVLDWRGRPVAEVCVLANEVVQGAAANPFGQQASTDASGRFSIPLYDEGDYQVGTTGSPTHPRSDCPTVRVTAGGEPPVTLHLAEAARVEGNVFGVEQGSKITVTSRLLPENDLDYEVPVDANGHFVFDNLANGRRYSLQLFVDEHYLVSAETVAGSGEVVELRNPAGEGAVTVELTGDAVASLPAGERRSVMLVEVSAEGDVRQTLAEHTPGDRLQVVFEHPRPAAHALAVLLVDGTERARSGLFAIGAHRIETTVEVRPLGMVELDAVAEIPLGTAVYATLRRADGQEFVRGGSARLAQGRPWRGSVQAGDYLLRITTEAPGRRPDVLDLPCRVFAGQTTRLRVP